MAQAHIIEVDDIAAGIVVADSHGFRFFAAEHTFRELEGMIFRTVEHASRAARALRAAARGRNKKPSQDGPVMTAYPAVLLPF